ncbi:MAG TPA: DUF305 domain-containing protein [Aurantimonas coralicida]|uniref:DUF305 domain-containing protein n=2 Tax=root TaxID=1 RepID=A0A9C9NJ47_9HYPH|nr:DUF305 domain-containing protein [Aurantimonas coralicida]HEU02781.1 DUF305 domain-containing protein [Aurantimonas coralicida]
MRKFLATAALAAVLALPAGAGFAQDAPKAGGDDMGKMMQGQADMQGQTMSMQEGVDPTQSSQGYMDAMQRMQEQMGATQMTGDADTDFAKMMIPHHQSAIEMAKVELENGKDEELKTLAQKMIDDQEKEIEQLQTWLERNEKK